VIAADDGVMPQTREHWTVLRALGIDRGVVALTKCDAAPEEARLLARVEAEELAPGIPVVEVSARTGAGLEELRGALAAAADLVQGKAGRRDWPPRPPVLHLDRSFTLRGIGTVVTGTLRGGELRREERVRVLPSERVARVRSIEVHGRRVEVAGPGRRVAVNLAGIDRDEVRAGDVVAGIDAGLAPSFRLDVSLDFDPTVLARARRVQVHHGTRTAPARVVDLGEGLAQLRLESPLIAEPGDRVVIRRIAPPATFGGGVVIDPAPARHAAGDASARLHAAMDGEPGAMLRLALAEAPGGLPADPAAWRTTPLLGFALRRHDEDVWIAARDGLTKGGEAETDRDRLHAVTAGPEAPSAPDAAPLDERAVAVLGVLDGDGLQPRVPSAVATELGISAAEAEAGVAALIASGRAVRLRGDVVYPSERLERIVSLATGLARARSSISLAELRDDLRISRKYSQAIIEHLDATKVTVRHGDRHVLRKPR